MCREGGAGEGGCFSPFNLSSSRGSCVVPLGILRGGRGGGNQYCPQPLGGSWRVREEGGYEWFVEEHCVHFRFLRIDATASGFRFRTFSNTP